MFIPVYQCQVTIETFVYYCWQRLRLQRQLRMSLPQCWRWMHYCLSIWVLSSTNRICDPRRFHPASGFGYMSYHFVL